MNIQYRNIMPIAFALLSSFAVVNTSAGVHCYDFSDLDVGSEYSVGDVIDNQFAEIAIIPYVVNGNEFTAEVRGVDIIQSQIAGGSSPEAAVKLAGIHVKPKVPLKQVTLNIAQSISQTGGFATAVLGVNGDRREQEGFESFTGLFGLFSGILVTNSITSTPPSNWHRGTITMQALPLHRIYDFSLTGHTTHLDNLCMMY